MSPDRLSATFAALADPTRRAIRNDHARGAKHLKVLERAGLITRSRQAQWRPCQLNAAPLHQAADFIEKYRQFWEQSFDRLDSYLQTLQKKEKKNGRKKR